MGTGGGATISGGVLSLGVLSLLSSSAHGFHMSRTDIGSPRSAGRRHLTRRSWLQGVTFAGASAAAASGASATTEPPSQGFLGANDVAAKATGNVRDGADIDAALGITWGGRDRCDAANPLCGPDGQLRKEAAAAAPVPKTPDGVAITDTIELDIQIGRTNVGSLRVGLFGEASPQNVRNIVLLAESRYRSKPSDYATGWAWGTATNVQNGHRVSLGVARDDQGAAYSRRRGLRKAPEDFAPAERPPRNEDRVGEFDGSAAGFVSVPLGGLGDDLSLTVSSLVPGESGSDGGMRPPTSVVVGKLMDDESMAVLARLDALPVQRRAAGLPGKEGRPMLKVYITETRHGDVQVKSAATDEEDGGGG